MLTLESKLANAHATLGYARLLGRWDWRGAEAEFREAIRLEPNLGRARRGYVYLLTKANRRADASLMLKQLRGWEHVFPRAALSEAELLYNARDYTGGVAELEALVTNAPDYAPAHYLLALGYGHLKRLDRALAELDKAALLPEAYLSNKAWLYGTAGRVDEAERILSSCRQLGGDCLMGLIGLRRNEEALAVLQKALARRAPILLNLQSDPRFDPIRGDARFADLVKQVGFELADQTGN
jgi:tetratricopeptide (TPR) repeat protein